MTAQDQKTLKTCIKALNDILEMGKKDNSTQHNITPERKTIEFELGIIIDNLDRLKRNHWWPRRK